MTIYNLEIQLLLFFGALKLFFDFFVFLVKISRLYTHQPLSLWGIVVTRGGRAVRNSALTQKLPVDFFLFYIDKKINMTYVPGQFIPYIFLAPSHKRPFSKMVA